MRQQDTDRRWGITSPPARLAGPSIPEPGDNGPALLLPSLAAEVTGEVQSTTDIAQLTQRGEAKIGSGPHQVPIAVQVIERIGVHVARGVSVTDQRPAGDHEVPA